MCMIFVVVTEHYLQISTVDKVLDYNLCSGNYDGQLEGHIDLPANSIGICGLTNQSEHMQQQHVTKPDLVDGDYYTQYAFQVTQQFHAHTCSSDYVQYTECKMEMTLYVLTARMFFLDAMSINDSRKVSSYMYSCRYMV